MDSVTNKTKKSPPLHEFYGETHQIVKVFNWLIVAILIGLAIGVVYELYIRNIFVARWLGVALLPVLASLYFVHLRRIEWVAAFLAVVIISLITVVATSGRGIRQIGVIAYPVILMVASLVIQRRVMVFLTLYSIACAAWLVFGEIWGLYAPQIPSNVTPGEFWMVAVVLVFTAFMARLLTGALFQNSLRLQGELRERELVEQQRKILVKELEAKNAESETLRKSAAAVALSLDFDETVAHILDQLQQVVPYDSASVQLLAGDGLEIIGGCGFPEAKDAIGMRFVLNEADPAYPILRDGLPYVLHPDIQSTNERFKGFLHDHIRSWMAIPLHARGRLIGMFTLDGFAVNKFTEAHARFASTFANQVAVTLENARLYKDLQMELVERQKAEVELRQREVILEAIAASAEMLFKAPDWKTVMDGILERIGRTINASHAYLFEKHANQEGEAVLSIRFEWTSSSVLSDLRDPRYHEMPLIEPGLERWPESMMQNQPFIGDRVKSAAAEMELLNQRGMKAVIEVPVFVNGEWWGVIGFDDEIDAREWTSAEVDALKVAANVLAAALENARLYAELQSDLAIRQNLISELEAKNSELERFTYTVSHDLKSPLFTIRGFLGYLERDALAGNHVRMKSDMERITDATDKMQQLLNDLLELSRIGRLMNEPANVPSDDLVREAVELVQGRIMERGVAIHIDADMPNVHGDRPRLLEVVQNLVDNAVKFMGDQPDPRIEIGWDGREDSKLIFHVRDNGIGIPPEHHERIFGLFNKLDVKAEGTGIGLALVKRIVEVHGGRIWVRSEAGNGSTFYFTLPESPEAKHPGG
ncbi:MAG: GAF domain-containing protein [Anaerolineales bacterium]|nr:GAF domain-containing protein [Anaerolineales bacterium]